MTMNKVVKNSSFLIGSEVVCRLGAFVLAVWITRLLGAEGYGKFSFAMSFAMLFAIFSDMGLNIITVREMSREIGQATKYTSNMLIFRAALSLISWGLIFVFINLLGYDQNTKVIVYMLGWSVILNSFSETFNAVYRSFEKMEFVAIIVIIQRLAPLLVGLFVLLKGGGLRSLAQAYVIVAGIVLFINLIMLSANFFVPRFEFDFKFCFQIVRKALPLGLAVIFSMIYFRIGTIILSKMQGDSAVGWFSASYRLIESIMFIPISIMGALLPVFSKLYVTSPEKLLKDAQKTIELLLLLIFPMVTGIFLLSDKIIMFLYGAQFVNSISALRILIWAEIFIFVNYVLTHLLIVCNRQKLNTLINLIACVFSVSLNFILIPRLSYIGTSITAVATELLMFALCYYFLKKHFGVIDLKKIAVKPLAASAVMGILVMLSRNCNLFVSVFIGFLSYIILLFLAGSIKFKDKFIWIPS